MHYRFSLTSIAFLTENVEVCYYLSRLWSLSADTTICSYGEDRLGWETLIFSCKVWSVIQKPSIPFIIGTQLKTFTPHVHSLSQSSIKMKLKYLTSFHERKGVQQDHSRTCFINVDVTQVDFDLLASIRQFLNWVSTLLMWLCKRFFYEARWGFRWDAITAVSSAKLGDNGLLVTAKLQVL